MTEKFFQLKSFITYWLDAVDAHSLHSPFLYNFYTKVVLSKEINPKYNSIEDIRNTLLKDERILTVSDFGSGSQVLKSSSRTVRDIARTSSSQGKYSRIYARLISYFQCKTIFDLGTSLGINTLYLASGEGSEITSFEGSPEVASVARQSIDRLNSRNIRIIEGNLDTTLAIEVQKINSIDL
ncbi:MAG: class I SAM-dependent methyltransferase, partial [Chryseolinea sp.]